MPQCQSPFLELMFLLVKTFCKILGTDGPKHYLNYVKIWGFLSIFPRYNSALVRENTGQGKPVFWHILRSAEFNEPLLW